MASFNTSFTEFDIVYIHQVSIDDIVKFSGFGRLMYVPRSKEEHDVGFYSLDVKIGNILITMMSDYTTYERLSYLLEAQNAKHSD